MRRTDDDQAEMCARLCMVDAEQSHTPVNWTCRVDSLPGTTLRIAFAPVDADVRCGHAPTERAGLHLLDRAADRFTGFREERLAVGCGQRAVGVSVRGGMGMGEGDHHLSG